MNNKKVMMGVAAGAALGAIFGVLFAPDRGKSTRKLILDKGENYLTNLVTIMDEYVNMINEKMENINVEISEMSVKGKAKADDAVSIINEKLKEPSKP